MASKHKLSRWSATHHGVVTTADLVRYGFTDMQRRRLHADGTLTPVRRGLALVSAAPTSERQRLALVCIATGGAISHSTAARSAGFRRVPPDDCIHLTIANTRWVDVSGLGNVVLHRTRDLAKSDVVVHADGVRTTSAARTAFDMAALVDADALESMIEQGLDRQLFTMTTLWSTARRLARRGRPGSTRFVHVLASRPAWRKPVGSDLELRLEKALVARGLPTPVRQHPIVLPDGSTVHPDLCWPDVRLAVEVDHVTWHGGGLATTYDTWRDRQVRLVGWEVDRVTDDHVRRHLEATTREILTLHRQRADLARSVQ